MSKKITIPITDHETEGVCSIYYRTEYKLTTEGGYHLLPDVYTPPVVINNLVDDTEYDVRITRFCCDGSQSVPLELTVNTTEE
jgi:hypothetical protein